MGILTPSKRERYKDDYSFQEDRCSRARQLHCDRWCSGCYPGVRAQENQPPVITANDATVYLDSKFDPSVLNIVAQDREDGNITSSVTTSGNVDTSTPGQYPVTITATDSAGLSSSKTVTVTVLGADKLAPKNTVPVISANDVTLNVGDEFDVSQLNATATDAEDGDVTASIQVVENDVDTSTPGTYHVTLVASDSWDFQAKRILTVTVVEPSMEKPVDPKNPDQKDEDKQDEGKKDGEKKDGDKKTEDKDMDAKSEAPKSTEMKKSEEKKKSKDAKKPHARKSEAKKSEAATAHNNKRSLANTGASVLGIVLLGAALVGGGAFLMRRRRG